MNREEKVQNMTQETGEKATEEKAAAATGATEQSFMECLQEIHDKEESKKAAAWDAFTKEIDEWNKNKCRANHAAMLAAQAEAEAQEKVRQANEAQLALVRAEAKRYEKERRALERESEWNFLRGLSYGMGYSYRHVTRLHGQAIEELRKRCP